MGLTSTPMGDPTGGGGAARIGGGGGGLGESTGLARADVLGVAAPAAAGVVVVVVVVVGDGVDHTTPPDGDDRHLT